MKTAEDAVDTGHFKNREPLSDEHVCYTEQHGPKTEYRKGRTIKPDSWDEEFKNECSHGIHFFITRLEAERYE